MNIEQLIKRFENEVERQVRAEVKSKVYEALNSMSDKYQYGGMPYYYNAFDEAIEKIVKRGIEVVMQKHSTHVEEQLISSVENLLKEQQS